QERVLQKPNHVLEMPGGPLSLTLRGSLEPPPTTTSPVSSQEAVSCGDGDGIGVGVGPWKVQVERLFIQLQEQYKCHCEVDPCKLQTLLQRSTLGSEDVRVYCEAGEGFAVVVREGAELQAKLKELEAFQGQGLSSGKQEKISTTCRLGQAKLLLLGEVIEKDLASEVRKARKQVVHEVSLHLLSFLRQEYGKPEHLSSLLGLERHVEVELGDTELRLFALSSWKLDQAEKDLLGEFREEKIDLPNCSAMPAELKSKLEKKVMEMNQSSCQTVTIDQQGVLRYFQGLGMVGRRTKTVGGLQVVRCQGDITKEQADALLNAANEDLDHAGGVAAALSQAGGPEVQWASRDLVRQIGRVPTGTVVETTGGKLPCKMLLHAVGPVGGSVGGNECLLLEKTVKAALYLTETMVCVSLQTHPHTYTHTHAHTHTHH
ncbi:unnamed protein product, partial [Coregonus sp. 'balchen']